MVIYQGITVHKNKIIILKLKFINKTITRGIVSFFIEIYFLSSKNISISDYIYL